MPLCDFECAECGAVREHLIRGVEVPYCCGQAMIQKIGLPAMIRIKGQGYPSRRKWMDRWTPDSPPFETSSIHGEKS